MAKGMDGAGGKEPTPHGRSLPKPRPPQLGGSSKMPGLGAKRPSGSGEGSEDSKSKNPASNFADKAGLPKLGAAGTSAMGAEARRQSGEGRGPDKDEQKPTSKIPGGKKGLALAALPAAALAAQIAVLIMFGKLLKGIAMAVAAAAMNFWGMLAAWGMALAKQVGGAILGVGASISSAVGGVVSAATAGVSVLCGGLLALGVAGGAVVTNNAMETAQRSDGIIDCVPVAQRTLANVETSEGSMNAAANAEVIYSVLAAWGMPDENIAGILGNWDAESEIDPTGVETVFDEPHQIGPLKQEAWDLDWDIAAFNPAYASAYPAIDRMGIGLGQWTNGRNTLLTEYADGIGANWHELETQLGFMVSDDDPVRVAYINEMIEESKGSVEDATLFFMSEWEGLTDGSTSTRIDRAEHWMAMFSAWDTDQALADSILDQSGTTVDEANQARAAAVRAECQDDATAVAAGDSTYTGEISSEGWAAPTDTMHVTSLWGPRVNPNGSDGCRYHDGLDLDGQRGDPYYAAHDGVITDLDWMSTGGWTLTMELSDGSGFLNYLHTHSVPETAGGTPQFHVSVGDEVKAGDHIGNIGNTGVSFGAHLHFEIHEADSTWVGWPQGWSGTVNPKTLLEDQGFEFQGVSGDQNHC